MPVDLWSDIISGSGVPLPPLVGFEGLGRRACATLGMTLQLARHLSLPARTQIPGYVWAASLHLVDRGPDP